MAACRGGWFQTEDLITKIQDHPIIYSRGPPMYRDSERVSRAWADIAADLTDQDWDDLSSEAKEEKIQDLKNKWHSVNDSFCKELLKEKEESSSGAGATDRTKYKYTGILDFLRSSLEPTLTPNSMQDESPVEDRESEGAQEIENLEQEDLPCSGTTEDSQTSSTSLMPSTSTFLDLEPSPAHTTHMSHVAPTATSDTTASPSSSRSVNRQPKRQATALTKIQVHRQTITYLKEVVVNLVKREEERSQREEERSQREEERWQREKERWQREEERWQREEEREEERWQREEERWQREEERWQREEERRQIEEEERTNERSSSYQFLMSLVPFLDQVKPEKQLLARQAILYVIQQYIYPQCPPYSATDCLMPPHSALPSPAPPPMSQYPPYPPCYGQYPQYYHEGTDVPPSPLQHSPDSSTTGPAVPDSRSAATTPSPSPPPTDLI